MAWGLEWLSGNVNKATVSLKGRRDFQRRFLKNFKACNWEPHPLYSVFTQYDKEYYLKHKDAFLRKYRCFYAISKTISPQAIVELGTCAGSSADAYLSASPKASYLGIDMFGINTHHEDGSLWDPYQVATRLFESRGFSDCKLIKGDLRGISAIPCSADLVVVDAAHDFDNEYADLKLALTADPEFIFVDDVSDKAEAGPAVEEFLRKDLKGRVDFTVKIDYTGGGLVIKLKTACR